MNDGATVLIGLIVAIGATVVATNISRRKGRSRAWATFSFLFPPTLLLLLLLPSRRVDALSEDWVESPVLAQPAGTQVAMEHYQRGFFGKLVSVIFWCWQVFMLVWAISYLSEVGQLYGAGDDAQKMGAAFGGTIGVSVILWVWVIGSVIFGLMMFFTRGRKVITTRNF